MGKSNGHGSTKVEVEERTLTVKLTEAELLDRGEKMAATESAIGAFKEKRGILNRSIKDEETKRAELALAIELGQEQRPVKCSWIEDFPKNCWRLVRQDTGESVDTRAMTAQDRQGALELTPADEGLAPYAEVDIGEQQIVFKPGKKERAKGEDFDDTLAVGGRNTPAVGRRKSRREPALKPRSTKRSGTGNRAHA